MSKYADKICPVILGLCMYDKCVAYIPKITEKNWERPAKCNFLNTEFIE